MVLYVYIQLSLILCFSITSSYGGRLQQAPTCAAGFTLDLGRHDCVKAACAENTVLKKSSEETSTESDCICKYEVEESGWGRPQTYSETGNSCYNLGERVFCTQGYCLQGLVLLPAVRDKIKCGADACAWQEPQHAVSPSAWSEANKDSKSIFDFTYKGECYRTETQGFCKEGHVVRFIVPSSTPTCVRVDINGMPLGA